MRFLLRAVLFAAVTLSSAAGTRAAMAQGTPLHAVSAMTCSAGQVAKAPVLRWQGDAALKWATWNVVLGPRRVSARIVVVDVDPARVALSLDLARNGSVLMPWTLDAAADSTLLAMNAGQFTDVGPWGWVVHRGREWQRPGIGPLSGAFMVDSAGRVRIVASRALDSVKAVGRVHEALQSFPLLLERGRASRVLCDPTATLDRNHRDIRLALGLRDDGHVLVALSRYDGAGRFAERLPIGPTTMEMAEVMRQLGAVDALMLDGGLSAQLLFRDGAVTHRWDGLRSVPLALVGHRIP
ncbi:phosphodiester glycosidase family protein [Gemmatimonas sp.]|uniref:phosphodiester glycosidase family protein n=1 Tax=Gemmatimonas sp. TaxID=1962908 RepID=UPI00286D43FF|nr:phosphodiester glycosidase family protein [Gemmatimonas sp.]